MYKTYIIFFLAVFLIGCNNVFEYHPYDLRLDNKYKNINQKNIERIKAINTQKDTVCFIMMGDTQRWYDETEAFVKVVNQRNDIDFVIHGGDISDFGMKNEFCWIHDIMSKLTIPYVALIGNHDNLGSGREIYEVMYGDLNFSFTFSGIKFVCLNTNALEFDYSVPVPDFEFIEKEINDSLNIDIHSTIVAMHVQPGDEVFNNNVKGPFQYYINLLPNLRFCLHAHAHSLLVQDMFGDGIIYYGSDAINKRNYLLFTVTKDSYTYEVVYF